MSTKQQIRADMLAKRMGLSKDEQDIAAVKLSKQVMSWLGEENLLEQSSMIAGYMPIKNEIDVIPLMCDLENEGLLLSLPCIEGDSKLLKFRKWQQSDELIAGPHNIYQPKSSEQELLPHIMFVPLVAADRKGSRLGYGAGYYDITIKSHLEKNMRLITVGLAYDFQLIDSLPTEDHDQRLNHLFTPTRHIEL